MGLGGGRLPRHRRPRLYAVPHGRGGRRASARARPSPGRCHRGVPPASRHGTLGAREGRERGGGGSSRCARPHSPTRLPPGEVNAAVRSRRCRAPTPPSAPRAVPLAAASAASRPCRPRAVRRLSAPVQTRRSSRVRLCAGGSPPSTSRRPPTSRRGAGLRGGKSPAGVAPPLSGAPAAHRAGQPPPPAHRLRCGGCRRGRVRGNAEQSVSRGAPAQRRAAALAPPSRSRRGAPTSPGRGGGGTPVRVGTGTIRRQSGMAARCSSCTRSPATLPRRTSRITARTRANGVAPRRVVGRPSLDWSPPGIPTARAHTDGWSFGGSDGKRAECPAVAVLCGGGRAPRQLAARCFTASHHRRRPAAPPSSLMGRPAGFPVESGSGGAPVITPAQDLQTSHVGLKDLNHIAKFCSWVPLRSSVSARSLWLTL